MGLDTPVVNGPPLPPEIAVITDMPWQEFGHGVAPFQRAVNAMKWILTTEGSIDMADDWDSRIRHQVEESFHMLGSNYRDHVEEAARIVRELELEDFTTDRIFFNKLLSTGVSDGHIFSEAADELVTVLTISLHPGTFKDVYETSFHRSPTAGQETKLGYN